MIYIYYELNYNISIYIVIPYDDVLYMRTDVVTVTYDHVYTIYNIYIASHSPFPFEENYRIYLNFKCLSVHMYSR